jgi:hypothetical protein
MKMKSLHLEAKGVVVREKTKPLRWRKNAVRTGGLFAVIRSHGGAWQALRPTEGQEAWDSHAVFMNSLENEGFVILGGPLEGTSDVLLVVRAETPDEIIERLSADPRTGLDLLRVSRVAPWTLRLGSLS